MPWPRDIPKPVTTAFGVYAVINGTVVTVGLTAAGVFCVVTGTLLGRLVGVALLALLLILHRDLIRAARRRYSKDAFGDG